MPYLSLSSVMSEMNAEESRARGMLDLSTMNLTVPIPEEEVEPVLKEKPTPASPLADLMKIISGGGK